MNDWDVTITRLRDGAYLLHAHRRVVDGGDWREQWTRRFPSLQAAVTAAERFVGTYYDVTVICAGQWQVTRMVVEGIEGIEGDPR